MKYPILVILAALALVLSGCASNIREPVRPGSVKKGDVLVVGTIRFEPSIKFLDKGMNEKGQAATVVRQDPEIGLVVSENLSLADQGSLFPFGANVDTFHYAFAKSGEIFVAKAPARDFLALRGFEVFLNSTYDEFGNTIKYVGLFKIPVPAGAQAVYVGEIVIRLDQKYLPHGYVLEDKYDTAKLAFAERFPGFELVRTELVDLNPKK